MFVANFHDDDALMYALDTAANVGSLISTLSSPVTRNSVPENCILSGLWNDLHTLISVPMLSHDAMALELPAVAVATARPPTAVASA
jgi:hypothetical protein